MHLLADIDLTSVLVAAIISAPATIAAALAALAAYQTSRKVDATQADVRKIEIATNSMKDQLILATEKEALARGTAEGVQQEKDRTKC